MFDRNIQNYLTMCKLMSSDSLKKVNIYMYKQDLAINNLQGLICHKTQPNLFSDYSKHMYKFTNASAWAGSDTRSISYAEFNRFSFS